jgi:hypothetical protein
VDTSFVDDEGVLHLVDTKSSSISGFSGKKLKEKSRQLMLYAIGIHQMKKIPYDKITLEFNMCKYLNVSYLQENGKWSNPSAKERRKWVESQDKRIRKLLQREDKDVWEIEMIMDKVFKDNSLESLSKDVKERFKTSDCIIPVSISEKEARDLNDFLVDSCIEIERLEELAKTDMELAFPEPPLEDILEKDSYYYRVLAPQLLKYHKAYQENRMLIERDEEEGADESYESEDLLASLFA